VRPGAAAALAIYSSRPAAAVAPPAAGQRPLLCGSHDGRAGRAGRRRL